MGDRGTVEIHGWRWPRNGAGMMNHLRYNAGWHRNRIMNEPADEWRCVHVDCNEQNFIMRQQNVR